MTSGKREMKAGKKNGFKSFEEAVSLNRHDRAAEGEDRDDEWREMGQEDDGTESITLTPPARAHSKIVTNDKDIKGYKIGDGKGCTVAIAESRGIATETGLAALHPTLSRLDYAQFSDGQGCQQLLAVLDSLEPQEIILPVVSTTAHGASDSLYQNIDDRQSSSSSLAFILSIRYPYTRITYVARKAFSESIGLDYIKRFAVKSTLPSLLSTLGIGHYYALCSVSALFESLDIPALFLPNALQCRSLTIKEHMPTLDSGTMRNLRLLDASQDKTTYSLFKLLKSGCSTAGGKRLLKRWIQQPLADEDRIDQRLDGVEELIRHHDLDNTFTYLDSLKERLAALPDMDHVLAALMSVSIKSSSLKSSETSINNIIALKSILPVLSSIKHLTCPKTLKSRIFSKLQASLSHPDLDLIVNQLEEVINPDIQLQNSPVQLRNQRCFAVRAGHHTLLDVARTTYKETSNDVYDLINMYNTQHNLEIRLGFKNGAFSCALPLTGGGGKGIKKQKIAADVKLPDEFIHVVRKAKEISFTSLRLLSLNARLAETLTEVYLMSDDIISELLLFLRDHIHALYAVSEELAVIDGLVAFSCYARGTTTVRPTWSSDTIAVKAGRHPILEHALEHQTTTTGKSGLTIPHRFIPNDTFSDATCCVQVISGVNMSGKSVYLTQIGTLALLAHIGCPVPAEYVCFTVLKGGIHCVAGCAEDTEAGVSTFAAEMRDMSRVLEATANVGRRALVLVDELGRGTSHCDGLGLSVAICEALLQRPSNAMSHYFLVTHFSELVPLLSPFPNVMSLVCSVNEFEGDYTFAYNVVNGRCEVEHYGIKEAKKSGIPGDLVAEAKAISDQLAEAIRLKEVKKTAAEKRSALEHRVSNTLRHLNANSALDDDELLSYLTQFQASVKEELANIVMEDMDDADDKVENIASPE